jgi:hypothetical protein
MPERGRSYAWARHAHYGNKPVTALSPPAREGLLYALELTQDAENRRPENLLPLHERRAPLTIKELAERDQQPAQTIHAHIAAARNELFGPISDNAIHRRHARPEHNQPQARTCREPTCTTDLNKTHGNRRYCDDHATAAEHTRRHRQRTEQTANKRTPTSAPRPKTTR